LRLSRTHPKFIEKLFAVEAPEIENGVVEIKSVAAKPAPAPKLRFFQTMSTLMPSAPVSDKKAPG